MLEPGYQSEPRRKALTLTGGRSSFRQEPWKQHSGGDKKAANLTPEPSFLIPLAFGT